jgi:hypothetical protein
LVPAPEVLKILQGFNPWWGGKPSGAPGFRRVAFGVCQKHLGNRTLRRALHLTGPRRVGKTTVLHQLADAAIQGGQPPRSILYLSLEHPFLKLLPLPKVLELYHANVHPEGQPALLLLDEVHHAADWETHIKMLVDQRPEYRIVATGSASVIHRQRLAESGVGRWLTVPVPTLSFYEFARIRGEPPAGISDSLVPSELFSASRARLAATAAALRPLLPSFQRYLLVGGFPETALQPDTALAQRLLREDVVDRVLKRDMTALFGVRNVQDLERLFIYLCLHTGGVLAVRTCAELLEVTHVTIANHLDLLEQAHLIYRLAPVKTGGKKVLKARQKVYLVDAALRNAVLLRGEEVLASQEEMGGIIETSVLRHLKSYYYRDTPQLGYWRDQQDREVDILVKSPAYHIAVEVKYRAQPRIKEDSGLSRYCQQEKVTLSYVVTRHDEDFSSGVVPGTRTPCLRIPAHVMCYLLGQAERVLWGID